jgi:hypothetical protein
MLTLERPSRSCITCVTRQRKSKRGARMPKAVQRETWHGSVGDRMVEEFGERLQVDSPTALRERATMVKRTARRGASGRVEIVREVSGLG